ncbi:MAG TPA: hypothetical protein VOA87_21405 [Thermoanaerobaculia bacterium]|nr:hypothetical protein [Thermoanaerobaculia bacterium]
MIKKSEWTAAYDELSAAGRRELGEPPSEEELLAYERGELSEAEAARVRKLLVYYPELVRALEPFPFPYEGKPGDAGYLSDEEQEQDWASLRARLGELVAPTSGRAKASRDVQRTSEPVAVWLRRWRISAAAAAALAVLFAGLLVRTQRDIRQLQQELREPRYNVEHRLLLPDGQRGGTLEQPPIPLPSEADYLLLIPALINNPRFPDYRLDIVDLGTKPPRVIWTATGLRRRSDDTFEIWVPRSFLKPGEYRLVVYGLDGGRQETLATYTVRLSS